MTRMKYNRPNNGYESEPGRGRFEKKSRDRQPPKVRHQYHQVQIILERVGPHQARYHCVSCNQFVAWIGQTELARLKRLDMLPR